MALSHAILAALLGAPCSGYDLQKRFEGSVGFFWQASFQQIYRELNKLEELGWLTSSTVRQQNRPEKKIYQITEMGQESLKAWIAEPCDMAPIRDDLLVKVFAGSLVPTQAFLAELEHHQAQHRQRLAIYQQIEQQFFPTPESLSIADKFRYLALQNGIHYETAWLAWCEEAMGAIVSS
ncbi:MAG: PadR family transcriptional regulator [Leptolyngbyaceae cyanobacterium CSU_1_3]|nr:PadR family transcriptional regulator [Leptolyngbyaceae cyanobacterium CSU_1_3]